MPILKVVPGGLRLSIRVQPRARRTELAGTHGDSLKVRVAAPPVEGAANEALLRFLADLLDVPRSAVTIIGGAGGRSKVVELSGVSESTARARLGLGR